jgi:hypothetical protein
MYRLTHLKLFELSTQMVQEIPQFRVTEAGSTLNWQILNRNKTQTEQWDYRPHTSDKTHFLDVTIFFFLTTFSGHMQFSEYIKQYFKENDEDENIWMAADGFIFLALQVSRGRKKEAFFTEANIE